MLIRYFALSDGQLHRTAQAAMLAVWKGERPASSLGVAFADELPIITVVADEQLMPWWMTLMRVPLNEDLVTDVGRMEIARIVVELNNRRQGESLERYLENNPAVAHHLQGWPEDWRQQLAAVLDVPVMGLPGRVGIGGPLALAECMGMTVGGLMPRLQCMYEEERRERRLARDDDSR